MGHLKAQETRLDPDRRLDWKIWLTRRLYRLGYDRQRVLRLFGFIDWVLQLPEPQALDYWRQVQEIEEEKHMEYITSVERIGIEKGMQQGMQRGQAELVLRQLDKRFGGVSSRLADRVRVVPSELMPDLLDVALTATSLEEVAMAVETLARDADIRSQV